MSELYLFTTLSGLRYAFTPTIFSKALDGITYLPSPVTRSEIQLHENLQKSEVVFTFPITNAFAKSCVENFIEDTLLIEIFKNNQPFWKGRVIKADLKRVTVSILCDSGYNTLYRKMSGAKFSPFCWKTLYSGNCGVNPALYTNEYADYTLDSIYISVATGLPVNHFAGGVAILDNQIRGILASNETSIMLSDGFLLPASGTLTLRKGCSLTRVSCIGFNNLNNFGGYPYIPLKNPMSGTGLL